MTLYGWRSGATAIPEDSVLQLITDLIVGSGVVDMTAGQFLVSPHSSGLAVDVAVGRAYLCISGGNSYPSRMPTIASNLTITANNSGNPRYTSIVLYKSTSISPNADDSNTDFITTVDGTPGASPSKPTNANIQSAIGAGFPFVRLADVYVASGATSLSGGNIYDTRNPVRFRSDIVNQDIWVTPTVNVGGTTTLDLSQGKKFQINMGAGNTTLALLNVPLTCKSIVVRITQDGVGGRTVTWFSGLSWPNASAITLTTTASKSDEVVVNFLSVTNDSTNTSEGVIVHQNV